MSKSSDLGCQDNIKSVRTEMSFSWVCTEENCRHFQYISDNTYSIYGELVECERCEKAHRIILPWR